MRQNLCCLPGVKGSEWPSEVFFPFGDWAFVSEKILRSSQVTIPSSPARAMRASFSNSHCENQLEFLEGKFTKVRGAAPEVFYSMLAHTQPVVISHNYQLSVLTSSWIPKASAPWKQTELSQDVPVAPDIRVVAISIL